eukprot:4257217-Amphidinium_carterae.1
MQKRGSGQCLIKCLFLRGADVLPSLTLPFLSMVHKVVDSSVYESKQVELQQGFARKNLAL